MKSSACVPLLGVDFCAAPSRRKPITVARGCREGSVVRLVGLDTLPGLRRGDPARTVAPAHLVRRGAAPQPQPP